MSSAFLISCAAAAAAVLCAAPAWSQTTAPENAGRGGGQRFAAASGAEVYATVCQGCHMPEGKGAAGAGVYPALANNPRLGSSTYIVQTVVNGRRAMPPFGTMLDDAQIAQVASYIRTSFGNRYAEPVPAAEVKAARGAK